MMIWSVRMEDKIEDEYYPNRAALLIILSVDLLFTNQSGESFFF